jgi:cbb3-type cytochrome oxidase cytochrome c subunit
MVRAKREGGGGVMNFGPFIFLGSFVALLLSWAGLILVPQLQLKDLQPEKDNTSGLFKPAQPEGIALQGSGVYRANGCNYCHSQQVRQTGFAYDVVLEAAGDFPELFTKALMEVNPKWENFEAEMFAQAEGEVLFSNVDLFRKNFIEKGFEKAGVADLGVKIKYVFRPTGPDISRGWGQRGSVATDYLFDQPAMIGQQRIGPDLTTIGVRIQDASDETRQLLHLYNPRSVTDGSSMPAYRYLFRKQAIGEEPSSNALPLADVFAPEEGFEIVPKEEALQLVAYLKSLNVQSALFTAPMAPPSSK